MFNDLDFSDIFDILDWDKKNYRFNREEKDMHPFSVKNTKETSTIIHNVLGINKEDIKLTLLKENGNTYISIEGKSKDEITGKEYSVSSRFAIDGTQLELKKITSTMKNGLLYITIPFKKAEVSKENIQINIK